MWHIVNEFFKDQLNLDNRFWFTLKHLFIPAQLTRLYFSGKRRSQANPIRLYFVLALLTVALFGSVIQEYVDGVKAFGFDARKQVNATLDTLGHVLKDLDTPTDSIMATMRMKMRVQQDSIDLIDADGDLLRQYFEARADAPFKVSVHDISHLSAHQIVSARNMHGLEALYFRQKIKLYQRPDSLVSFALGNLGWILLAFIPLVALVLKMLYIRRSRYYIEHLVFALHQYGALLLLVVVALLAFRFFDQNLSGLLALAFAIYLFVAMLRYYGQGKIKTALKFVLLQFLCLIMAPLLLMFSLLVLLALF